METQILPGDLFNFDVEVDPILEVLVGKTPHVAMLEIMQEEELNAIAAQQLEFETIRISNCLRYSALRLRSRERLKKREESRARV